MGTIWLDWECIEAQRGIIEHVLRVLGNKESAIRGAFKKLSRGEMRLGLNPYNGNYVLEWSGDVDVRT